MNNNLAEEPVHSTIFDDVYRTIITKMPWTVIPLINEVFGTSYPEDSPITQVRNEFYEKSGKIVSDSIFLVQNKYYHFECQSSTDSTMVLRMFRYDTSIAMEHTTLLNGEYYINFPDSAVIYLRHSRNTPDEHHLHISFPDGSTVRYRTKVIKVQSYTKDEMFEKNLLLFLPFYIMRYEKHLNKYTNDEHNLSNLLREFEIIRDRLADELSDRSAIYDDLIELIIQISDYILRKEEKIKERMRALMGGEILELFSEKMARLDVEHNERMTGLLAEGKAQGIAEGKIKGKLEVITNMIKADLPLETIASVSNYSIEEILRIKQELAS